MINYHRFHFLGVGDSLKPGQKTYQCGTVSWDIKNACQAGSPEGSCEIAKQTVSELVTSLMPAEKNIIVLKTHPLILAWVTIPIV